MIGFVSRMNPVATLKPGVRYFQYGDAMTTTGRPDFALKDGSDLVIGADGTAILSPYSFQTLLGDVGISFDHVQKDMTIVRKVLAGTIGLTPGADEAILARHPGPAAWRNGCACFRVAWRLSAWMLDHCGRSLQSIT